MKIRRYEIVKSMHTIICAMNDGSAYAEWTYLVPDQASDYDLQDIAEDDELFNDTCELFRQIFAEFVNEKGYIYADRQAWG